MVRSGCEYVIVTVGLIYPLIISLVLHWAAADDISLSSRFAESRLYLLGPAILSMFLFIKASTLNGMQLREVITAMFGSPESFALKRTTEAQRASLAIELSKADIRSSGRFFAASVIGAIITLGVFYGFRQIPLPTTALGWFGAVIGITVCVFVWWRVTNVIVLLHDNPYLSHSEVAAVLDEARRRGSESPH